MRSSFVALLLFSVLTTPLLGKNIYVAQDPAADDQNPGTPALPVRTISRGVELAQPGDNVIVAEGDYRNDDAGAGPGIVSVSKSGGPGEWISIRAKADETPVVRSFLLTNCSYVRVTDMHLDDVDFSSVANWQDMPVIVYDEYSLPRPDYTLDYATRATQVEAEFATYFQLIQQLEYTYGVGVEDSDNILVARNQIDGYWGGVGCQNSTNVCVSTNSIQHAVNGIIASGLQESVFTKNTVQQTLDVGITVRDASEGVVIRNNSVQHSGITHISLHTDVRDTRIIDNDLSFGGYYCETAEFPGGSGISVHTSLDKNVVRNNVVSYHIDLTNVDGNGIILDFTKNGKSVLIADNLLMRNMGSGINLTESPNSRIFRNTIMESGYQSAGYRVGVGIKLSRDGDINNRILDNHLISNREAGILAYKRIYKQKEIDRNHYTTQGEPLIWDGFDIDQADYRSLEEVQIQTGFELNGTWEHQFDQSDND